MSMAKPPGFPRSCSRPMGVGPGRLFGRLGLPALMAALLLLPLQAAALELGDLMGLLAQRQSGDARFTEERFVQGLEQPLSSSGMLSFSAPDRFSRRTLQPRAESMTVEGQRVTLERNGRKRQMALDAVPEMGAILTAVRGTLTGNADALREAFVPTVSGQASAWTLVLTPRDDRLQAVIRQLRIEGRQSDMRRVEVMLTDGDRSVMSILPLAAGEAPQGRAASAP